MIAELCSLACAGFAGMAFWRAGYAVRRANQAMRALSRCWERLRELEAELEVADEEALDVRATPEALRDLELALGRRLKRHLEARDREAGRQAVALGRLVVRVDALADHLGATGREVAHLGSMVQHVGGGMFQYTVPHVN